MNPTRASALIMALVVMLCVSLVTLSARAATGRQFDVPEVAVVFDGAGIKVEQPTLIQVAAVPLVFKFNFSERSAAGSSHGLKRLEQSARAIPRIDLEQPEPVPLL